MAQFDQAARYLIRRAPLSFFRWVIPCFLERWHFRGFRDTSTVAFPGEPDRVCDTVAEFHRIGCPQQRCLVDAEAQAQPHVDMLERLGEYTYRLRRELRHGRGRRGKYAVLTVLLNMTGSVQPHELDMTVAEVDGAGSRLVVVQRTLREEDATATLAQVERGELDRPILPWVALMRDAGRAAIIKEWKRLALLEPDDRWRSDLGALALIFADLAGRKAAWQAILGDWDVKESQVIKEWTEQARAEEKILNLRASVARALDRRFPGPLPEDLLAAIVAATDPDELSLWFDAALTASSLDDFRAAVRL
jgi:hypothetical protein